MRIILPVKLYEYDFYTKSYDIVMVNKEVDIDERWEDVIFRNKRSGYKISNLGNVKKPNGDPAPIYFDKDGYTRFNLYIPKNNKIYNNKEKISYPYKIHRAVAEAFVENPDPRKYKLVMHRNDIRDCNVYTNLMWGDSQMNMDDKKASNRSHYLKGEEKSEAMFDEDIVRKVCECVYIKGMHYKKDIIKELGMSERSPEYLKSFKNLIANIIKKHCWKYIIDEYV